MAGRVALVDSGFDGSIGLRVWERLAALHGTDWQDIRPNLPIGLMHAHQNAPWGRQLAPAEFEDEARALPPNSQPFPRTADVHRPEDIRPVVAALQGGARLSYQFACFVQCLPRYHDRYEHLAERAGRIMAFPRGSDKQMMAVNDEAIEKPGIVNASNVSPLAAAIVQYRTVKWALAHARG